MGAAAWWLGLAALSVVMATAALYALGMLMLVLALLPPARTAPDSTLRAALKPTTPEVSRRAAAEASLRWVRAYTTTSRNWRLIQVSFASALAAAGLAAARWRRRALLLTGPGASLRVLQQRDGTWRLDDVAGWPIGAGRARPLLARVCAAADTAAVTVTLNASSPKVAAAVYAPLGFQACPGSWRMVRPPQAPSNTLPRVGLDAAGDGC